MTKAEVVDQVADEAELSKADAGRAVDAVLGVIADALARGGEVNFTGFGKFSASERGARQGVNPQTGERIEISASRVPRFSAGSTLKKSVKGG
ncbi:MAG: HU family DNA-binding protein [Thermoleophilaceae bacterium]|nr:HU family DNA-binding protein [Thermoleophilaceae bacterium]